MTISLRDPLRYKAIWLTTNTPFHNVFDSQVLIFEE